MGGFLFRGDGLSRLRGLWVARGMPGGAGLRFWGRLPSSPSNYGAPAAKRARCFGRAPWLDALGGRGVARAEAQRGSVEPSAPTRDGIRGRDAEVWSPPALSIFRLFRPFLPSHLLCDKQERCCREPRLQRLGRTTRCEAGADGRPGGAGRAGRGQGAVPRRRPGVGLWRRAGPRARPAESPGTGADGAASGARLCWSGV